MPDDPDRSTLEAATWIFVTVASLKPLMAKRILFEHGGAGEGYYIMTNGTEGGLCCSRAFFAQ